MSAGSPTGSRPGTRDRNFPLFYAAKQAALSGQLDRAAVEGFVEAARGRACAREPEARRHRVRPRAAEREAWVPQPLSGASRRGRRAEMTIAGHASTGRGRVRARPGRATEPAAAAMSARPPTGPLPSGGSGRSSTGAGSHSRMPGQPGARAALAGTASGAAGLPSWLACPPGHEQAAVRRPGIAAADPADPPADGRAILAIRPSADLVAPYVLVGAAGTRHRVQALVAAGCPRRSSPGS